MVAVGPAPHGIFIYINSSGIRGNSVYKNLPFGIGTYRKRIYFKLKPICGSGWVKRYKWLSANGGITQYCFIHNTTGFWRTFYYPLFNKFNLA